MFSLLMLLYGEIPIAENPVDDEQEKEGEAEVEPVVEGEKPRLFEERYVKQLREESKKWRLRLKELEGQIDTDRQAREAEQKQAERAKMDDVNRLQAEREDLIKQKEQALEMAKQANEIVGQTIRDNAILEEANRQGFRNPEIAKRLLGESAFAFEIDQGRIADTQEIADVLSALLESDPYLRRDDYKSNPKSISQPSNVVVKDPVLSDIDEEIEGYNKQIRENIKTRPLEAVAAFNRKYLAIQKKSAKPVQVK